jgi:tripartite-type tricarboxylate transporter receptor subunit TctC
MRNLVFSFVLIALLIAAPVFAQSYPAKPVTVIVPFPPGGPLDSSARLIGKALADRMKQPVVIDNRSGAGGTVGTVAAAKAAADGYTLLWAASSGLVIAPAMYAQLGYDPIKSFSPVTLMVRGQQVLVARANLEFTSLRELVSASRANPGQFTYGSPGSGSAPHLVVELLKSVSGAAFVHVPYKGGAQALSDLLGGHIDLMINSILLLSPQIRTGKVKALAVSGRTRDPLLPQVPTMAEALNVDFEGYSWFGLAAPAGTPAVIVNWLSAELNALLADKQVRGDLAEQGLEPVGGTPEQFAQTIAQELKKWSVAIKAAGIKAD